MINTGMSNYKKFAEFYAEKTVAEGATIAGGQSGVAQPGMAPAPAGSAAAIMAQQKKNMMLAKARMPFDAKLDQNKIRTAQQVMATNNGQLDMDTAMDVANAMKKATKPGMGMMGM